MLGCETSKITELTHNTGKQVFSFQTVVDVIMGARILYCDYQISNLPKSMVIQKWAQKIKLSEYAEKVYFVTNKIEFAWSASDQVLALGQHT